MKIRAFLVLVLVPLAFAQAGGDGVGNGGGFASCGDDRLYSYDYLLTQNSAIGPAAAGLSFRERIDSISRNLHRLQEPLVDSFDEFFALLYSQVPGKPFQWFEKENLPLMWEPGLDENFPSACRTRRQAVYYFAPFAGVPYASYKYDPKLIANVAAQHEGELQVAYLWVHEWLWNHFPREKFYELAEMNRLLQSRDLATISLGDYEKARAALVPKRR